MQHHFGIKLTPTPPLVTFHHSSYKKSTQLCTESYWLYYDFCDRTTFQTPSLLSHTSSHRAQPPPHPQSMTSFTDDPCTAYCHHERTEWFCGFLFTLPCEHSDLLYGFSVTLKWHMRMQWCSCGCLFLHDKGYRVSYWHVHASHLFQGAACSPAITNDCDAWENQFIYCSHKFLHLPCTTMRKVFPTVPFYAPGNPMSLNSVSLTALPHWLSSISTTV
jgi:hypothetical protein